MELSKGSVQEQSSSRRRTGLGVAVAVICCCLVSLGGCEIEDAADNGRTQAQKRAAKHKKQLARAKMERLRELAKAKRRAKAAVKEAYEQAQAAAAEPEPSPSAEPTASSCHPDYSGACLDPNAYDYDCEGGSGDGPEYTGYVEVVGGDPYDLDSDGDGTGCE